jgi:hypothetical protein
MSDDALSLSDRVDRVSTRAFAVDEAVINLHAFRSLLDDLSSRGPLTLPREHQRAIEMVRAAILRSTIGLVVAILDPPDYCKERANRASLGQILEFLKDDAVADRLTQSDPGRFGKPSPHKLAELRSRYTETFKGERLNRVRNLRHKLAHLLVSEGDLPVEYDDLFALADEVQEQVIMLFQAIGLRNPHFVTFEETTAGRAKLFWKTYLAGVEHVPDGAGPHE